MSQHGNSQRPSRDTGDATADDIISPEDDEVDWVVQNLRTYTRGGPPPAKKVKSEFEEDVEDERPESDRPRSGILKEKISCPSSDSSDAVAFQYKIGQN